MGIRWHSDFQSLGFVAIGPNRRVKCGQGTEDS